MSQHIFSFLQYLDCIFVSHSCFNEFSDRYLTVDAFASLVNVTEASNNLHQRKKK